MKPEEIKDLADVYNNIIRLTQLKLRALQEGCPHWNLQQTRIADMGNWDRSLDTVYTKYHCQDCNKRWAMDDI